MIDQISWIIFAIPALLIASSVHEFSHAWAAYKLGDYTAKMEGRLTLNPLAHIDPIGALMMIVARIGWSKPVPINEYNFKNRITGTALTALAGPASNIILAFLLSIILKLFYSDFVSTIFQNGVFNSITVTSASNVIPSILLVLIFVNISLGVFNLIPIPPLDGHKIFRAIIPASLRYYWEALEKYGIWIIIILFFPLSPLAYITGSFLAFAISGILTVFLRI